MKGLLVEIRTLNAMLVKAPKRKEESWRESLHLLGEYLNNSIEIAGRTIDVKDDSGEISNGNEEQAIENWRKNDPGYKVAKNLAELYSTILWKVELANNEIGCLAEISKQSIEGKAWVLLTT